MELKSNVEFVTPELAREWLTKNHPQNRPIRETRVRMYAEEMSAGRWRVTHQGVAFDSDGALIDGQHRLMAIVRTGAATHMMVTRGLLVDTFALLDQGAFRSAADILRLPTWHVAALRCLMTLEHYDSNFASRVRPRDLETRFKQGVEVIAHLRSLNLSNNGFTIAPIVGALSYAHPVDPEIVENFFGQVVRGEMLERNDPAYRLRAWVDGRRGGGITGAGSWLTMMATLQALHHMIVPGTHKISALQPGETGYRIITGRRRARGVPNTPSVAVLPL